MISETAYSSIIKLLGISLLIGEHGIGYSNLAFAAKKGQKIPIFIFKPFKHLEGLDSEIEHKYKRIYKKEYFKIWNFHLPF